MCKTLEKIDKEYLSKINRLRKRISLQENSVINPKSYELESLTFKVLLIVEENDFEGYLTLDKEGENSPSNEIHLNVFIDPNYQDRGLGSKLISKAKEVAKNQLRANKITIMVLKRIPDLYCYYKKRDFKLTTENTYCWRMEYAIE